MKKMNNKGFSLVELIIVIAIMAILIVVLAPQYLKYVEKSRNSTDLQSVTELKDACEVWAADPDAGTGTGETAFKGGDTGAIVFGATAPASVPAAVQSAMDNSGLKLDSIKCVSRNAWQTITVNYRVATNGTIVWWYQNTGGEGTDAFAKAIGGNATDPGAGSGE